MHVMKALEAGALAGPEEWFTGPTWLEEVIEAPPPSRLRALRVYFGAGARTAWHTHPVGQTLLVLEGVARVQSDGSPVAELSPGDVVFFGAGERHWHGAAPTRPMVHLALQEADASGSTTEWAEHVSDEQYGA
jgi:quercetin dioxygenase-like cupin family protein